MATIATLVSLPQVAIETSQAPLVHTVLAEELHTPQQSEGTAEKKHTSADVVEREVRHYFADVPVLAEIAFCESRFRQVDAQGRPLRGVVNSKDVGVMQINETYHAKTASELGLDIHTLEGNLAYARYLYDREGTQPWSASSFCWRGRSLALR